MTGHPHYTATTTVADYGEKPTIAALVAAAARHAPQQAGALLVPSGDDAAVVAGPPRLVLTCDMGIEGRHFRRDWCPPRAIGHMLAIRNLADIAAMGGRSEHLLVSIGCPAATRVQDLVDLTEGIAAISATHGAAICGGDLVQSPHWVVSLSATGAVTDPLTLTGAQVGQDIILLGQVGRAAAGVDALTAGFRHGAAPAPLDAVIEAFFYPTPPLYGGPALVGRATSLTDTSDGLISDLGDICRGSGVGADLDPSALAPEPLLVSAGQRLGCDPWQWVLHGGEDHALVGTCADAAALPAPLGARRIGRISATPGLRLDGTTLTPAGFATFS